MVSIEEIKEGDGKTLSYKLNISQPCPDCKEPMDLTIDNFFGQDKYSCWRCKKTYAVEIEGDYTVIQEPSGPDR